MTEKPITSVPSIVYSGKFDHSDTTVSIEKPVNLTVNGEIWLTFLCTPKELDFLGAGFLFNEGVIKSVDEIESIDVCDNNVNIDIWLNKSVNKPEHWFRTSGCAGGATIRDLESIQPIDLAFPIITTKTVTEVLSALYDKQELYRNTGGVHSSILSNGSKTIASAEDIGRHNTLDKIAGYLVLNNIKLDPVKIMVTTGRITSEMLSKTGRIGTSIVLSRTSPSSLSIEFAEKWGITLIGYARRNQFRIYTHPHRIVD